ncbi:MAG TPA: peptide-N-glycosidase F-related protein [Polyangia bacterium]|jgi:hypothetical protein
MFSPGRNFLLAALFLTAAPACKSNVSAESPDAGTDLPPAGPTTTMVFDNAHIGSDGTKPDYHLATAPLDLSAGPFAQASLSLDLSSPCFPFEKWQSDPPPAGQNWPADCDAFDRNFEITLDDPVAPATTPPAIELTRAITPFGGPLHVDIDITDLANGLPGMHRLQVMIPTFADPAGKVSGSNGGWFISGSVTTQGGPPPRKVLAVIPLFNGSQTTPAPLPAVPFTVPAGTTAGRVEYRVTGHGAGAPTDGCNGPAEEFCHRTHSVFVDDAKLQDVDPWRVDCGALCTVMHSAVLNNDYCAQNPCGALGSVRAPRANWCPGSVTRPFNIEAPVLGAPGDHTFHFTISDLAMDGSWRISAVYFAFGS